MHTYYYKLFYRNRSFVTWSLEAVVESLELSEGLLKSIEIGDGFNIDLDGLGSRFVRIERISIEDKVPSKYKYEDDSDEVQHQELAREARARGSQAYTDFLS